MDDLQAGMENLNLTTDKHEIKKGFALVIINEKFRYYRDCNGASADKANIKRFCEKAGFTVNEIDSLNLNPSQMNDLEFNKDGLKTDNLTKRQMETLFKTISKGNFEAYDAFICFISSHGNKGGILGTDGEVIPVEKIVDQFKASEEFPSLINKPKLFFNQNCRGFRKGKGVVAELDGGKDDGPEDRCGSDDDGSVGDEFDDESDYDDESDDEEEYDNANVPMTIPTTADVLVAYSTVNGYKSVRDKKSGSWFITVLTQVFEKYAENTDLTAMLATVNKVVATKERKKKEKSKEPEKQNKFEIGEKQMPCFTSTLRNRVYFKLTPGLEGSILKESNVHSETIQ